jgi:hypothetical protein
VQQKENKNALHPSDSVIRLQSERMNIIMRLRTRMLYYDILQNTTAALTTRTLYNYIGMKTRIYMVGMIFPYFQGRHGIPMVGMVFTWIKCHFPGWNGFSTVNMVVPWLDSYFCG